MGQPGYWLSISSIRDSQIMVEDFSKVFPLDSEEKQCYVAQLSILASQSIKPDTIHAEYGKNGIFVSYDIYDEDNLVSYQPSGIKMDAPLTFQLSAISMVSVN